MAEELFIAFKVQGIARPAGSKVSFVPLHPTIKLPYWKGSRGCPSCRGESSVKKCQHSKCKPRIVVSTVDDCTEGKAWKAFVHSCAKQAMKAKGLKVIDAAADGLKDLTPLRLIARFYKKRPDAHFRTGKFASLLRDDAPLKPTGKPDVGKLTRAVEDAMTGAIYKDDAQICMRTDSKEFGTENKVDIEIWILK